MFVNDKSGVSRVRSRLGGITDTPNGLKQLLTGITDQIGVKDSHKYLMKQLLKLEPITKKSEIIKEKVPVVKLKYKC